jgi:signal transduction histidine kinase
VTSTKPAQAGPPSPITWPAPTALVTRPAQTATERLTRMIYAAMGPTAVAFGLLSLNTFLVQAAPHAGALPSASWVLVFGLPTMIGVLSTWGPLRLMRAMAWAEGGVFLVILTYWLLFRAVPLPAAHDIPWIISLTGVPAVAMATVAPYWVAWGYTALVSGMSGVLRAATSAEPNPGLVGVEDSLYALLVVGVFVGLTLVTRRSAARLDAAVGVARDNSAGRAARVARKQERLTIDALVHDSVISTLLMAGRGGVATEVVSQHAAKTLRQLDALRAPRPDATVAGSAVVSRVAALTAELAPDAALRTDLHDALEVPPVAVAALLGAVGEALRNSVAAAGAGQRRAVVRTVVVTASRRGIRVVVHDDGVGFDPRRVPAERLGIAQSIIGRMERIAGGAAAVWSRPGDGTEVVVSWTP